MHFEPKCKNIRHKCTRICISESCKLPNPFVCDQCVNHHKKQQCSVIQYKDLVRKLHKLQGLNKTELFKYQEYVEDTFRTLIKSLQSEFVKFRDHFENLNAPVSVVQFYEALKSHNENKLTARDIHRMINGRFDIHQTYKLKSQAVMWSLSSELIEIQKKVNAKLPHYYNIYADEKGQSVKQISLDVSQNNQMKLIEKKFRYYRDQLKGGLLEFHINAFQEIIKTDIHNIQLLYRASEHQFSAEAFHTACNGKNNTLTIAKTQYGKIVAGFTAVTWQSPKNWQYIQDPSNQTFLFSFGKYFSGLKFQPFKKKFTIGMHREYGPCFGDDLVIHDRSSTSKNCWSNFPDCYQCNTNKIEHNQKTIGEWIGVKDHFKKFNIVEWQVYKVSFNKKQEQQASYMVQYHKL